MARRNGVTRVVKRVFHAFGLDVVRVPAGGPALPSDIEDEVVPIIRRALPHTMTGVGRLYNLCRAVEYVVTQSIPGDIVECGVWRGGSCMAAALQLQRLGDTSRTLWLYDTFDGMTEPGTHDRSYDGETAWEVFRRRRPRDGDIRQWALATLDTVEEVMRQTAYPRDKLRYVVGKVEETLPRGHSGGIAVLRLDTDWYESTRAEMQYLFPQLAVGGVLLVDDYGTFTGAARAVDEYLRAHRVRMLLTRVDGGLYMGVKPDPSPPLTPVGDR